MPRSAGWNRRDLLKLFGLAAPAAALAPRAAAALGAAARAAQAGQPAPGEAAAPPATAAGERGPRKKVVVAGAGLAGLAAAWELVQLGHDVTVLEARLRPGGRVYTLSEPFADGLYVDAGGMDYSDAYRQFIRYVKVFKLSNAPVSPEPLGTVYHLRGTRLEVKPQKGAAPPAWPYKLTPEEARLGIGGMFGKYFAAADALGDPTAPDYAIAAAARYDKLTLAGFLAAQGASPEAIELLGRAMWFGFGIDQVAALHRLLSDVALFCMGQQTRVLVGGSGMLPRAFAAALGDRIRYGSPITRVVTHVGSVKVIYGQPGSEQSIEADRLICTLPLPAMGRIRFTPALSPAKRQAIERLAYNPVTRIFLQARTRSWIAAGDSGYAFTDLPIQNVEEQPLVRGAATTARGIVECHIKGAEAAQVAAMEPAAQIAMAVDNMEKVFPGFKAQYETGVAVAWGSDPWAGGAYAWWKPGQMTDYVPELMRHEGRLHFAGEHTSWIGRTMEGALESGNRAAHEVNLAPKPRSPLAGAD